MAGPCLSTGVLIEVTLGVWPQLRSTRSSLTRIRPPSSSGTISWQNFNGGLMPLPFHLVLLGVSFSESIHLHLCPLHRLCPHFSSPPIQQPQQQPSERGPSNAPGPPFFSSLLLFSLLLPPLPFRGTSSAPRGPQLRLEPQGPLSSLGNQNNIISPSPSINLSFSPPLSRTRPLILAARRHTSFPSLNHPHTQAGNGLSGQSLRLSAFPSSTTHQPRGVYPSQVAVEFSSR
ncbi:hypothetical protein BKA56DRAFT_181222 [Ilyonectria sp. MPI-CAGE-AT-0026]|nr:hypothetical protein BKA56DRAFT_181222 [Ilyonectria sp. MPI-CAGE-AT-0026]